ncbi:MAG: N-acetyltransferase [Vicinamibacteraceae bacterium]
MIAVRDEQPGDLAAIRAVNDAAFDQPLEGRIVEALRAHGAVRLSLVAEVDGRVVGHILFSPVTSAGSEGLGLGPMAVTPEQQRRGVGGALIEAALARLRAAGCPFVVVLGHHGFYTRFGFVPASRHGLRCEWDVPDEAFMVHVIDAAATATASGLITYRPEFLMEMPG